MARDGSEEECGWCRFWLTSIEGEYSQCRRYPPTFVNEENQGLWPETFITDWCGEFSPEPEVCETPDALRSSFARIPRLVTADPPGLETPRGIAGCFGGIAGAGSGGGVDVLALVEAKRESYYEVQRHNNHVFRSALVSLTADIDRTQWPALNTPPVDPTNP